MVLAVFHHFTPETILVRAFFLCCYELLTYPQKEPAAMKHFMELNNYAQAIVLIKKIGMGKY